MDEPPEPPPGSCVMWLEAAGRAEIVQIACTGYVGWTSHIRPDRIAISDGDYVIPINGPGDLHYEWVLLGGGTVVMLIKTAKVRALVQQNREI